MSEPKAMQATPHADLMVQLLDSRVPKSEREHAAVREIERLRADLAHAERCLDSYADENQRLFDRAEKAEAALPTAEQIEEIKRLVRAFLDDGAADATQYLIPGNGCGQDWFVNRCLWWFDGPRSRALHAALDALRKE